MRVKICLGYLRAALDSYEATVFPDRLHLIHLHETGFLDEDGVSVPCPSGHIEYAFNFERRQWDVAVYDKGILEVFEHNCQPPAAWDERDWAIVNRMRKALEEGIEI